MRIVLIGYGRMGRAVEQAAFRRGHCIVGRIDADSPDDWRYVNPQETDMAIEFTAPQAAEANVRRALQAGVPVVTGTTGWETDVLRNGYPSDATGWIWSSNFSIGVNIMFAVNQYLARLMQPFAQYHPALTETHHIHKLDKPSGTAKRLLCDLQTAGCHDVPVESIREGEVAGIHKVEWDSAEDAVALTHTAKSREGFALGAVLAAEWLKGRRGFHTMQEVMNINV